jgi:hypothetical protein
MAYFLNAAANVVRQALSDDYEVTNDFCFIVLRHKPTQNVEKYFYLTDGNFISKSEYYRETIDEFLFSADQLIRIVSCNLYVDLSDIDDVLAYEEVKTA